MVSASVGLDGYGPMLTGQRLCPVRPGVKGIAHWDPMGGWAAADLVRRDVTGGEVTLPLVWLLDGVAAPVITWRPEALQDRLASGRGPVLHRALLQDRLTHGRDRLEPAVLTIDAFVAVQAMPKAISTMAWLSGYAAVAAAVPQPPGADSWSAWECDYYGFTIAGVEQDRAQLLVQGRTEGRGAHLPVTHHIRLLEEQLFDIAIRVGVVPVT